MQLLTDLPPLQRRLNFLPRDAMRKRGLCCRPVSVRPSVCHVGVCIKTAENIVKLLSRPGSSIILFFDPERWYPVPGNPLAGRKIHGGGKILRFSTEIAVCLGNGTRWVHSCYGTLTGNHRWRIDLCGFR